LTRLHAIPSLLLLIAALALGIFLAWQYLRRVRSKPAHGAVHLMLGVAGLELMVMLRRGAPDGTVMAADALGTAAAFLLAMAMISGLLSPIVARYWRRKAANVALAIHSGFGAVGFVLFIGWFAQL
jgi:CDP-diglyceride synthetase